MSTEKEAITAWSKEAKKALIDKDMTATDLAKEINLSKSYVAAVIGGRFDYPAIRERISDYLGISSV